MNRAVVQVFAYAEPDLRSTLDAYADVDVPPGWELEYQACVTPENAVANSPGRVQNVVYQQIDHAREHPVFDLFQTPTGKLQSRNEAHDAAMRDGFDVIISGDGDAPPLSQSYFTELLAPFASAQTVGVCGFHRPEGVLYPLMMPVHYADLYALNPIYGRSSAFRSSAWEEAGPFRVADVDPTDVHSVRREEEFGFRRRLEQLGDVVNVRSAKVRADSRRWRCQIDRGFETFGRPRTGRCERIGSETFQPRDE